MFATLDDVKDWLNIKGAADDRPLERLITSVTAAMKTYTSRDIVTATYTDNLDGPGGTFMMMRQYPITAVASVTVDGVAITDFTFNEGGVYLSNGRRFTRGRNNVRVTYTAGFATVPDDLNQACIETVAMRWKERTRIGHASQTMSGGGETIAFDLKDFNSQTKTLLNQYMRRFPA